MFQPTVHKTWLQKRQPFENETIHIFPHSHFIIKLRRLDGTVKLHRHFSLNYTFTFQYAINHPAVLAKGKIILRGNNFGLPLLSSLCFVNSRVGFCNEIDL